MPRHPNPSLQLVGLLCFGFALALSVLLTAEAAPQTAANSSGRSLLTSVDDEAAGEKFFDAEDWLSPKSDAKGYQVDHYDELEDHEEDEEEKEDEGNKDNEFYYDAQEEFAFGSEEDQERICQGAGFEECDSCCTRQAFDRSFWIGQTGECLCYMRHGEANACRDAHAKLTCRLCCSAASYREFDFNISTKTCLCSTPEEHSR